MSGDSNGGKKRPDATSVWLRSLLDECERVGFDNDLHGEPLLMALPQIIAVVDAAERTVYAEINGVVDEQGRIFTREHLQMLAIDDCRHALTALQKKLEQW